MMIHQLLIVFCWLNYLNCLLKYIRALCYYYLIVINIHIDEWIHYIKCWIKIVWYTFYYYLIFIYFHIEIGCILGVIFIMNVFEIVNQLNLFIIIKYINIII